QGVHVVGLDVCPEMLRVAKKKARGIANVRWVQRDMRSFELRERFGVILIPGHSFQNLLTPEDQASCLSACVKHLVAGGRLVIHVDHPEVDWLGGLVKEGGGAFSDAERFVHPVTGRRIRTSRAWSYEAHTQTAIQETIWEELDADGGVANRWESGPIRIHCVFRHEMEHLLARAGLVVDGVFGDFLGGELAECSSEMIWLARRQE
ncbi:MAG: class I SAM-dependent methyltransferase, partial [Candidatus Bipolaricaulota bacterium]